METTETVAELRAAIARFRADGATITFVPTMGALHAGHLALVRQAQALAAPGRPHRVVASIFVNPAQFAPHEDLARYPRPLARDQALLAAEGCDLLFLPTPELVYPSSFATFVEPAGAARGLEGDFRPQFFRGVATVVTKLFNLVQPDQAVFGQKDAQQLAVVRQLVRDLDLPIAIVAGPTVREPDGLALSSRNVYLSAAERAAATVLFRSLGAAVARAVAGERKAEVVRQVLRAGLVQEPLVTTVDYAEVVDAASFQPVATLTSSVVLPLAVHIGTTRLIDNVVLAVADDGTVTLLPTS